MFVLLSPSIRAISQPLDLIMAAVDTKGTMKDFCSPACLSSFKSGSTQTQKSVCNICKKVCSVSTFFLLVPGCSEFLFFPLLWLKKKSYLLPLIAYTCTSQCLLQELYVFIIPFNGILLILTTKQKIMFFITYNLMSMAPFSPTSDQMWADPEWGRRQVLQPLLLRWFLQEQHGHLWELQICVPQQTAHAEAGGWYQNILQWWLSEAVQRGADTKLWDQNVVMSYTKTQRSLFKKTFILQNSRMLLRCTTCLFSRPVSDMVNFKNDENVVQLFCGRFCVKSYKLRPTDEMDQGNPQWICQTFPFFTSFYWIFRSKSETL